MVPGSLVPSSSVPGTISIHRYPTKQLTNGGKTNNVQLYK